MYKTHKHDIVTKDNLKVAGSTVMLRLNIPMTKRVEHGHVMSRPDRASPTKEGEELI